MPSLREMMNVNNDIVKEIPLNQIHKSELNFYESYGQSDFDLKVISLMSSIKEKGLLEPIVVLKQENGYEILSGHTRFEAICKLHEQGLYDESISAIVKNEPLQDDQKLAMIIEGNIQRTKTLEQKKVEIKYYEKQFDELRSRNLVSGRKDDYVAEKMGCSSKTIRNLRTKFEQIENSNSESGGQRESEPTIEEFKKRVKKISKAIQKTIDYSENLSLDDSISYAIAQLKEEIDSIIERID